MAFERQKGRQLENYFKYGQGLPHDDKYSIKRVSNLIPIEIEYKSGESPELKSAMAFIDYATQEIRLTDGLELVSPDAFKTAVLGYMMRRHFNHQFDYPQPDESAMEEMNRQKIKSDKEINFGSESD